MDFKKNNLDTDFPQSNIKLKQPIDHMEINQNYLAAFVRGDNDKGQKKKNRRSKFDKNKPKLKVGEPIDVNTGIFANVKDKKNLHNKKQKTPVKISMGKSKNTNDFIQSIPQRDYKYSMGLKERKFEDEKKDDEFVDAYLKKEFNSEKSTKENKITKNFEDPSCDQFKAESEMFPNSQYDFNSTEWNSIDPSIFDWNCFGMKKEVLRAAINLNENDI